MTICERIFDMIDKKGLKSADLARLLNIKQSVLSNWRKRNTNPPIEYALAICEFLEISIEELITGIPGENLNTEEQELVDAYRRAGVNERRAILTNAKILAPESGELSSSRTG